MVLHKLTETLESSHSYILIIFASNYCVLAVLPDGWYRFNTSLFKLIAERKPWAEAKAACLKLGGNLASIASEHENQFLLETIAAYVANGKIPSFVLVGSIFLYPVLKVQHSRNVHFCSESQVNIFALTKGLTLETSANKLFTAFSISTSTSRSLIRSTSNQISTYLFPRKGVTL